MLSLLIHDKDEGIDRMCEGENNMNRTEASFAVRRNDRVLAMLGLADCVVLGSFVS